MNRFAGRRIDDGLDADNGLETMVEGLVADAYGVDAARAQSIPERDDENVDPGHPPDPLDPRPGHRPKPTDPLPLDTPPVPKLRPLE